MRKRTIGAAAAAVAAMLCALTVAAWAQAPTAPADPGARLTGAWHLNRDLSTPASEIESQQPAESPRSGGSPGGGSSGGGGGGGRRPGGAGGVGGGVGGYGGAGRGGQTGGSTSTQQQMAQARLILHELTDPSDVVTIIVKDNTVNITDSGGRIEKYMIDGAKHEVEMSATKVDATVSWNTNVLKALYEKGSSTITRTWQATDDGSQLVETVTLGGGSAGSRGGASGKPIKFVFDRQ
jgi:hypothetical protein